MIVLGLTGSIGMGKTTAAKMLRGLGLPLFDADAVVHRLIAKGGAAVDPVEAAFPGVRAASGGIDRALLGRRVFGGSAALARLEQILHPIVRAEERRFLVRARKQRRPVAVLDIPLLFETGGERRCHYVMVVTAPAFLQRQRVMRRPGMTRERFEAILAKQMPDGEKRRRADFIVQTGLGRNLTLRRLDAIVRLLRTGGGRCKPGKRRRGR